MKYPSLLVAFFAAFTANAQKASINADRSNEYITDYSNQLTLRVFGSRKINGYQVGRAGKREEVEYSPNDVTSVGVGFTYRFIGLNLNFKVPFLNNDDDKYGKTKSLDLASYIYLRKFTIDAFAQHYKGHYLSDNDFISSRLQEQPYAIRPDLETRSYGVNAHYIFNHRQFSFRASFLQNEWQRKSAGSLLAGINIHYVRVNADSSIVPDEQQGSGMEKATVIFDRSKMASIGVDGGYAHTFVFGNEHWFTTVAFMGGIGVNNTSISSESTQHSESSFGLNLNTTIRIATGYNSERWFAGVYYVNFINRNFGSIGSTRIWQQTENGLYRLVVARRIDVKRR